MKTKTNQEVTGIMQVIELVIAMALGFFCLWLTTTYGLIGFVLMLPIGFCLLFKFGKK